MAADFAATFSESWHRVAGQRIFLRPAVKVRRENFRGQRWIVLENPFNNQYFRLRPEAYEFVARLGPDRTVEEVWKNCLERLPDTAPGQEAVIQLLSQLYQANLLQYNLADDTAELFRRHERVQQRERRARWSNIMFMRFPLLDPDRFLLGIMPLIRKWISPAGAIVWLVTVAWALKVVIDHAPELLHNAQETLSPGNLPLLYLGLVLIKTLHEFGHASFCRRFGGEVHVMGVMFLIFTPVPYMDATSSWGLRSRWQRILVGGAGMIVELFVAALAAFVWAGTGQGVIHNLAYNMMFVASISTLVFNLNPLLRYDGYYMLSDFLEIPNLHQRAGQQLQFLAEKCLFGIRNVEGAAHSRKEAGWLTVFGVASHAYRIFVFSAILLFVADRFLLIGIVIALACLVSWVAVPLTRLCLYLANSPKLQRHRLRAIAITGGGVVAILAFLQFVPFPNHFRASGVLRSRNWAQVYNESPGKMERILSEPGSMVVKGQALVELANPEIEFELSHARSNLDEMQARLRHALQEQTADLEPLRSRLESVRLRLKILEEDKSSLVVRARQSGKWVLPGIEDYAGRWLDRGTELGLIVDPSAFQFVATVSQEDGGELFAGKVSGAQVMLYGQTEAVVFVDGIQVIPGERKDLPSAALGGAAGGDVPVTARDPGGRRAVEPFFEVLANVTEPKGATLLHGRSGKVRFNLESEPLLPNWTRRLRQLLQKRYQL